MDGVWERLNRMAQARDQQDRARRIDLGKMRKEEKEPMAEHPSGMSDKEYVKLLEEAEHTPENWLKDKLAGVVKEELMRSEDQKFQPGEAPEPEFYQDKARRLVFEYAKSRLEVTDTHVRFSPDDVYIVWAAFILGNWKCLVSTTMPDQMYYEVTHDMHRKQTYIDAYKKWNNVCISEGEDSIA